MIEPRDRLRSLARGLTRLVGICLLVFAGPAISYHWNWDSDHDPIKPKKPPTPSTGPSTCNPCKPGSTSSPAYAASGYAVWSTTDIELRGRPSLRVLRTYNSSDPVIGIFGTGWSSNIDISLYPATSSFVPQRIFKDGQGKRYIYTRRADGSFAPPAGRYDTVTETPAGATLAMLDGQRYTFAPDGRILQQTDNNGNQLAYSYDSALRVSGIADGKGRTLGLAYNAQSLISLIQDHAGRIWRYGYDLNGNLSTVTDPLGGVMRYTWQAFKGDGDGHTYQQLLSQTDPSGVLTVSYTYVYDLVNSYTEGQNRTYYARAYANTALLGQVTRTDLMNTTTSYTYGELGLITQDTDAANVPTSYTHDPNGLQLNEGNPTGETYDVTLTDISGKIRFQQTVQNFVEWSTADLPSGVYLLKIAGKGAVETHKLMKF